MTRPVIMCRLRPPIGLEERAVYVKHENNKESVIIPPGEQYSFTKVFGEQATHNEVFGAVQEYVSLDKDCTVLFQGATGAGKSSCMMGLLSLVPEILPTNEPFEFSALEVYNGKVTSLVSARPILHKDVGVYVRQAMNKRTTGATLANAQSSRSHVFISFRLVQRNSVLTFVDLAGSERMIQTGNDPIRKQEAIQVNRSLSTLRDVVECLATQKPYIPWRNSQLTQQLRQVLRSPDGVLLVMLCVNHNTQQTMETLRFGRKATKINKCKIPPPSAFPLPEEKEEKVAAQQTEMAKLVEDYKTKYENTQKELETVKDQLLHSRKRPRCGVCGEEGHNKRTCTSLTRRSPPSEMS